MIPHLVTMSGPGVVRLELHTSKGAAFVEGDVGQAIGNAWCILDSAARAAEKAGQPFPLMARLALSLLGKAVP